MSGEIPIRPIDRRGFIKYVGGSAAGAGVIGAASSSATADLDTESEEDWEHPDWEDEFDDHAEHWQYEHETHMSTHVGVLWDGQQTGSSRYRFRVGVGGTACTEDENEDPYPGIGYSEVQLQWDDDEHWYNNVNTDPFDIDPRGLAYQDTTDDDPYTGAGVHLMKTAAGYLVSRFTKLGWVWTGTTLAANVLSEFVDDDDDDGFHRSMFDWVDYDWYRPQAHYWTPFDVYLEEGDSISIDVYNSAEGGTFTPSTFNGAEVWCWVSDNGNGYCTISEL